MTMTKAPALPQSAPVSSPHWKCVEAGGPWPFITRRVYEQLDQARHVWESRVHRKQLARTTGATTATSTSLNRWIAILFAFGAAMFALGCVLSLNPSLIHQAGLSPLQVNAVFFAGSIPFTTAAYLQLFQAANAPEGHAPGARSPSRRCLLGWRPREIGWLSCALQFPGTVLFNINTFDAMIPGWTWYQQDLGVWIPNLLGSILFLASGYLAFTEVCHAHWAWKPTSLSWWVTFVNLLGCLGFMVAALFAFVPPPPPESTWITLSLGFTLKGASCFFLGASLMLAESRQD
jgi:hypothetical protein